MTYQLYKRPPQLHRLRVWILLGLLLAGFSSGSLGYAISSAAAENNPAPSSGSLLISEVQTGGCVTTNPCTEDAKQEFIELHNPADTSVQITGWKLRYLSSSGSTVTDLLTITGQIDPEGYMLFSHIGFLGETADLTFGSGTDSGKLAKSAGHVEIVDSSGIVVDRVGWGNASLALTKPVNAPSAGQSIERQKDSDGQLLHTGDNSKDFATQPQPTPQGGGFTAITPPQPEPTLTCEGVVISELLPNPAGSDTGLEFIELHNPTDEVIGLQGCSLQANGSNSAYTFDTVGLQPGEYRSFSDIVTGLTLPNANGGTVWLLSPTDELQTVTYPANLEDDAAWIAELGIWSLSYTPTPGSQNLSTPTKPCPAGQVRNPDTDRCVTAAADDTGNGPVPCAPGQERNPETNRCRAASTAIAATTCPAGQVRNPETNRCRNVTTAANTPTPCKEGQERNPETNRCRNIASSTTDAKPCPTGQERNPETNRCRKIAASGAASGSGNGLGGVEDIASSSASQGKPYWIIALVILGGAAAYAVYEWRQEIQEFLRRRFDRLKPTTSNA